MKKHEGYKIVKTYTKHVEGLDFPIEARILKRKVPQEDYTDYYYEVSHYYKPSEAAWGVYIPGSMYGKTFEEAEHNMFFYLNPFTVIGVKPNSNW